MTLTEKVAYLKGLMEGLNIGKDTAEGKVLCAMADILDDLATSVVDLEDSMAEAQGYLDELDDDLAAVEEYLDEECDGDCENCDACDDCDLACDCEGIEEDEEYYEVECPNCGETICFDCSVDLENLICPACNEKFSCEVEIEDLKAIDGE